MDARNKRSLDNMVDSLIGQIDLNGPVVQFVQNFTG